MKDQHASSSANSKHDMKKLLQERFIEDIGDVLLAWNVKEYEQYKRGVWWYSIAGIIAVALVIYAIIDSNFLFGVIIVFVALIIVIQMFRTPDILTVAITTRGMIIEDQMYDYENLESFWIHYDPPRLKEMGISFTMKWRPELSIPLENANPLKIRAILSKYINEEEREESATSIIGRILKL